MLRLVLKEVHSQLKDKSCFAVFYGLLIFVLINYCRNVFAFKGMDIVHMYDPMKLLLLSYNQTYYNATNYLIMVQLYPLLVIIPSGFSYIRDVQTGRSLYVISRIGRRRYLIMKAVASFVTAFMIFTLPFLLEMILNVVSFPMSAAGDLSNLGHYDPFYLESVQGYLFTTLFRRSSVLYSVMMILVFGIGSGLLSMLTVSLSMIVRFKYRVMAFLPNFILMNGLVWINAFMNGRIKSVNLFHYMMLFNDEPKYSWFMPVIFMAFIVLTVLFCRLGIMKDEYAG